MCSCNNNLYRNVNNTDIQVYPLPPVVVELYTALLNRNFFRKQNTFLKDLEELLPNTPAFSRILYTEH